MYLKIKFVLDVTDVSLNKNNVCKYKPTTNTFFFRIQIKLSLWYDKFYNTINDNHTARIFKLIIFDN